MKFNFENLFWAAILLFIGFVSFSDGEFRSHGYGFTIEWWVQYVFIAAGALFLIVELIACRKRK